MTKGQRSNRETADYILKIKRFSTSWFAKINFSQRILCCFCKARFRIPPGENRKKAPQSLTWMISLENVMRKIIWTVASAFILSGAANALETDVAPKVTDIQNHQPSTALYVGNSYSFYNCGVHGYVRGLQKKARLLGKPVCKQFLLGNSLSITFRSTWHLMKEIPT